MNASMRRPRFSSLARSILAFGMIALPIGCSASPSSDYVTADRRTHDAIAPTLIGILDGTLPLADITVDEKQDIRNTLDVWDLRIRGAEGTPSQATPAEALRPTPLATESPPGR